MWVQPAGGVAKGVGNREVRLVQPYRENWELKSQIRVSGDLLTSNVASVLGKVTYNGTRVPPLGFRNTWAHWSSFPRNYSRQPLIVANQIYRGWNMINIWLGEGDINLLGKSLSFVDVARNVGIAHHWNTPEASLLTTVPTGTRSWCLLYMIMCSQISF